MGLEVASDFWSGTVFEHWEKAPFVLRASDATPSVPLERVWPLLVAAGEARRGASGKAPSLRFWIERSEPMDVDSYLPSREHATIGAYLAPLLERVGANDFTLVVNGAQALSRDLFRDLRVFVEPLVTHAGLAVNETAIYLSRARRTVFGVHCDESSNFLFVAYGTKRFRLWPREVLDAHPHVKYTVEYGEIAHLSTLVVLQPGDLLYMPSGCYHIAESDGEIGLHFSLGTKVDPEMVRSMLEQAAARVVTERLRGIDSVAFLPAERRGALHLPPPLASGLSALAGDFSEDVERALVEHWARLASAGGFTKVPPAVAEEPLADDARIRITPGGRILFDVRDGELLLAALGHALRLPAHPSLVRLVERLNAGGVWPVGALLAEHAGTVLVDGVEFEADGEGVRQVLESLVALGALSTVTTEG